MSYTCPVCGKTSYHPEDERRRYCARCHRFEDDPRMTRDEHLSWAKRRALEYVDAGELALAVTSLATDLLKHPDFDRHLVATLAMGAQQTINSPQEIRDWINGFQ